MSIFRQRIFAGAGATAALTAAMAFAATPASATTFSVSTYPSGKYSQGQGFMDFDNYGEHFRVCDVWADGAGTIGYWKIGTGGSSHSIYAGGGAQTCEERNEAIAEGTDIYIKVCLRDNGTVVTATCSAWRYAYA